MKTIDNVRWLEINRYQRRRAAGLRAGIAITLALWAAIVAAVVALT